MKRTALLLIIAVLLCSCAAQSPVQENTTSTTATIPTQSPAWTEEDRTAQTEGAVLVTLADNATTVQGDGVTVKGNVVTVTKAGCYEIRGTLSDGQLRVETDGKSTVTLILNGMNIHSRTTAPLFVRKSAKTIVTLADGSQNTLSDSADAVYEDVQNEEPSAALFSKSDLVINGGGTLTVNAAFNDGIVSRDGLKITDGSITVDAADDAVMGRDYVLIGGGTLSVTAKGDGIKSTNDNDETVGYITVEGGEVVVKSEKDGLQAKGALTIQGGNISVTAGGGSRNASYHSGYGFGFGANNADSSAEGKGIKAGATLTVSGGNVQIDAADDALHSNYAVQVLGGTLAAAAGDDGIHADEELTISAGVCRVTQSYEGLEAKTITINGGDVSVVASDDGVNAAGGSDSGNMYQSMFASDGSAFNIHGGHIVIDAKGDGLDSNGNVTMTGGEVYVVGPSSGGNGSLDFNGTFDITGGKLVAIGSSDMAETPSTNIMNSITWNGFSMYDADKLTVTAADGTVLAELEALRDATWMYVTCPELKTGEDVTVTCGTQSKTFTIQEGGNREGTSGGGFGGGFGGGPGGGGFGGGPGGRPGRP